MRRYTFTLKDETEYEVPIESESEEKAEEILNKMFDFLKCGGFLVTYCAKGIIKRRLQKVGFKIISLPGPTGKREMTMAMKK